MERVGGYVTKLFGVLPVSASGGQMISVRRLLMQENQGTRIYSFLSRVQIWPVDGTRQEMLSIQERDGSDRIDFCSSYVEPSE